MLDNLDLRFDEANIIVKVVIIIFPASNRVRVLLLSVLLDVENQQFYSSFRGSMISALDFYPLRTMTSML